MDKNEKKLYNRMNYLKNREKILSNKKSRSKSNIVPLFSAAISSQEIKGKLTRLRIFEFDILSMGILVTLMTFFLIREATAFYASVDQNWIEAFVKALILEGAVIAFSLIRGNTLFTRWVYKLMIAAIYTYSIWVLSATVVHKGIQKYRDASLNQSIVQELEKEIQQKQMSRDRYWKLNRISFSRKYETAIDSLNQKLSQARQQLVQIPDAKVIWNTVITLVVFRILVMISNLLCIQHLERRLRNSD